MFRRDTLTPSMGVTNIPPDVVLLLVKGINGLKTALLLWKFVQSGYSKYFKLFLKPRHSVQNTHISPVNGWVTLPHQCISLLSIFVSTLYVMLQ